MNDHPPIIDARIARAIPDSVRIGHFESVSSMAGEADPRMDDTASGGLAATIDSAHCFAICLLHSRPPSSAYE